MFKDFTGKVVIPLKSRIEVLEIWCITFWLPLMHKNCTGMEGVIVCICKIWDGSDCSNFSGIYLMWTSQNCIHFFFWHGSYNLWMNKIILDQCEFCHNRSTLDRIQWNPNLWDMHCNFRLVIVTSLCDWVSLFFVGFALLYSYRLTFI